MQLKKTLLRSIWIVSVVGIILFLIITFCLPGHVYYHYYTTVSSPSVALPSRLKIPKINVDAAVEYVGIASDGSMDVPKGPANVAWFKLGSKPGENGSAVIAGHYGTWKTGGGSVFDDLNKLRPGDKLYVEDSEGNTTSFVVRESRRYIPSADDLDVFTSKDGASHLNLVTCEGIWDNVSKTYSNRLVVFTDKEI